MIKIGVVGGGHWGPNHIRVFNQLPQSNVLMVADLDEGRLSAVNAMYPSICTTTNYKDVLANKDIDAICVATPTHTHFQISHDALEAEKHVLCEKPLTLESQESLRLQDLAQKKRKVLMVGHVFVFNSGIIRIKEYIKSGDLGFVHYAHSERTNLGPFRYDVNALWDLAPHDVSIFNYLFDSFPVSVSARGQKCLGKDLEDLAFVTLDYPNNILVNIHVSWLDPKKVRQITVVGDKKMVSWNDLDNEGPIKLYDKHVERTSTFYESYGDFQLLSKEGSITIPKVVSGEPLKAQAQYFLQCLEKNAQPDLSDAKKGYDVVKTLNAVQKSIEQNGIPVAVTQ